MIKFHEKVANSRSLLRSSSYIFSIFRVVVFIDISLNECLRRDDNSDTNMDFDSNECPLFLDSDLDVTIL